MSEFERELPNVISQVSKARPGAPNHLWMVRCEPPTTCVQYGSHFQKHFKYFGMHDAKWSLMKRAVNLATRAIGMSVSLR